MVTLPQPPTSPPPSVMVTLPKPPTSPFPARLTYFLPDVLYETDEEIPKPPYAAPIPLAVSMLLKGVSPLVVYDTLRRIGLPQDAAMRARGYGPLFAQCIGSLAYRSRLWTNDTPETALTPQFIHLLAELQSFGDDRDRQLYHFTSQARGAAFDTVSFAPVHILWSNSHSSS
jgi:hypothetical protein